MAARPHALGRPTDSVLLKDSFTLLFVCTGNACRSQMAEGWVRHLAKQYQFPSFQACSAGLEAHGLNPEAVRSMAACRVDISAHESKLLTPALLEQADLVVTVCDRADASCPVLPAGVSRVHLPFPDPAAATGTAAERARVFDAVRDGIRVQLERLLQELAVQAHSDLGLDSAFGQDAVRILSRRREHAGFIPIDELQLQHRLFNGGWSAVLRRELATRPPAVGVLLYDPVLEQVVMLRQFRTGLVEGTHSPWLLEIVAGLAGVGEALIDVVKRESLEETGLRVSQILPICEYFNSPGWTDEKVNLFCARVDARMAQGVHGVDAEHEDILVLKIPTEEAFAAVRQGRICNAMSLIALQWLELNRDSLRQRWAGAE